MGKNSNERLPKIDYSKLPNDIREAIEPISYIIEETSKLTWDKRQFIIRIPKEITEEANLTTKNLIKFKFTKPSKKSNEIPRLEISVV